MKLFLKKILSIFFKAVLTSFPPELLKYLKEMAPSDAALLDYLCISSALSTHPTKFLSNTSQYQNSINFITNTFNEKPNFYMLT